MQQVKISEGITWTVGKKPRPVKRVMKRRLKAVSLKLTAKITKAPSHEEDQEPRAKTFTELEKERAAQVIGGWFSQPVAPVAQPYLRKVNREFELSSLLGARAHVVWVYPASVGGALETICYYTDADPIILVSWWSTARLFNQVMAEFQRLRMNADVLVKDGIKFWQGKILPEAILAEFNQDQIKYIREWVFDIIETVDVVPTPERREHRLERYSWLNMEEW